MKRALLVGLGTIAGTAAVLAYQPGTLFGTGTAQAGTDSSPVSPPQSPSHPSLAAPSPKTAPQTITGDLVQTKWGPVQVAVTVDGGQVTDVHTLVAPDGDPHSARISARAIPRLEQQALKVQSARIDGVSGASYTSQGFAQSLQSALIQAGLA